MMDKTQLVKNTSATDKSAIFAKILGVTIGTAVVAMLLSPYFVLNEIKTAIHNGDADKLSAFIDFPSVREGFKSNVNVAANRQIENNPTMKDNPLAQIGVMFGAAVAETAIDSLVSPRGVASLLIVKSPSPVSDTNNSGDEMQKNGTKPKSELGVDCNYESFNQFAARLKNTESGQLGPSILLSRVGLFSWKITKVNLHLTDE